MGDDFEQRVRDAIANPRNLGELKDADAVGSAGSAGCGDLMRLWLKFKEERGRRVIDQASFQSFGCETAIAVASLATELLRGKTADEARALKGRDLAADLGPLPPMKIHCGELVEAALRDALEAGDNPQPPAKADAVPAAPTLSDSLNQAGRATSGRKIVLLS
ncbi:MAG: iron-sulfur cluster assembly scaffold protein [Limisphaerales bacterium]